MRGTGNMETDRICGGTGELILESGGVYDKHQDKSKKAVPSFIRGVGWAGHNFIFCLFLSCFFLKKIY